MIQSLHPQAGVFRMLQVPGLCRMFGRRRWLRLWLLFVPDESDILVFLQQDGSSLGSNGSKHTGPVLCHDSIDDAGFYTVKYEIANSGNEMAIRIYGDPLLYTMSVWAVWPWQETYLRSELLLKRFIILRSITGVYPDRWAVYVSKHHTDIYAREDQKL